MSCLSYECWRTYSSIVDMFASIEVDVNSVLFILWAVIGLRWYLKHTHLSALAVYMTYGSLIFISLNAYNMFVNSTNILTNLTIIAIAIVISIAGFRLMRTVA